MTVSPRQVLMIVPELFAPGGIQYVCREALAALTRPFEHDVADVWTLRDASVPPEFDGGLARILCAGGSRLRLIQWTLAAAAASSPALNVVAMHVHLVPLTIPLALRGASVSVILYGAEAWRRLSIGQRAALNRVDRIIAISAYTANRFREANPQFGETLIAICAPGVPAVGGPGGAQRIEPLSALSVSRLSAEDRYKGHDALIEAWPSVVAEVPGATLVVVGDGDDRGRLEALAAARGMSSAVRFVGHVSDTELVAWYERCAFFVLPSVGEGFGLVFLEAMRAAKACIGCGGAPAEIIEDETTGLLVQGHNPALLTRAIVRLYTDPSLRDRLGKAGHARWQSLFTRERFAERFRAATALDKSLRAA